MKQQRRTGVLWLLYHCLLLSLGGVTVFAKLYENDYCPLMTLLPFADQIDVNLYFRGNATESALISRQASGKASYSFLAAAQMAIEHFNARDTVVVTELASLQSCPVQVPVQIVRDSSQDVAGIQALVNDIPIFQSLSNGTQEFPCAVLGPAASKKYDLLASTTMAFGIPQVSYLSGGKRVTDPLTPSTLGVSLDGSAITYGIFSYLAFVLQRTRMALLIDTKPESAFVRRDFVALIERTGYDMEILSIQSPTVDANTLQEVKAAGMRTIVFNIVLPDDIYKAAQQLEEQGMLNGDYLFVINTELGMLDFLEDIVGPQKPGSAVDKFLTGLLMFRSLDPFERNPDQDRFLQAWRQQSTEMVQNVNDMVPKNKDSGKAIIRGDDDYFQSTLPTRRASFIYDAVMAIGFGACRTLNDDKNDDARPPPPKAGSPGNIPPPPNGKGPPQSARAGDMPELSKAILQSTFQGASGIVTFPPSRGPSAFRKIRDVNAVALGAFNVRGNTVDSDTGKRSYRAVLTSVLEAGELNDDGLTERGEWNHQEAFLYRNGSTDPPPDFVYSDENYLSHQVRAIGLSLLALAWFLAFAGAFLVAYLRKEKVIRQSQPFFLVLICIGSAISATSIFTLSQDEETGWTSSRLTAACMATPWFFFLGQVVLFSAMFTKLYRLDRVLQFRRRTVGIKDVMLPLVMLTIFTLVILFTWTIVDPWKWVREEISASETYGECQNDNFWHFFGPLMATMVTSQALTVWFAIKTTDVPGDLRESNAVLLAIATTIQAWIVGVPILAVLGNDSVDATFFGRVLLIFALSVSGVVIVVLPKVNLTLRLRCKPELGNAADNSRVRISGLTTPASSTRQLQHPDNSGSSSLLNKPNIPVTSDSTGSSTSPKEHKVNDTFASKHFSKDNGNQSANGISTETNEMTC